MLAAAPGIRAGTCPTFCAGTDTQRCGLAELRAQGESECGIGDGGGGAGGGNERLSMTCGSTSMSGVWRT